MNVLPNDTNVNLRQTQSSRALATGTWLQDYEIGDLIGSGGFSIVYRARERLLDRPVAIKEYLPPLAWRGGDTMTAVVSQADVESFTEGLRRFLGEARLLAQFDNPALVKVLRFWEENGTAYMSMPLYQGPTLHRALLDGRFKPDEASLRQLLDPLLEALSLLHSAKVYHRDVSPDNILLTDKGPVLLDLGAARQAMGLSQHFTVILKDGYAPVEQYPGEIRQGPWTDIYALCGVMRFAITGKKPHPATTRLRADPMLPLRDIAGDKYSQSFLRAIDAGMAVWPEDRPPDVAQLRTLLNPPPAVIQNNFLVISTDVDHTYTRETVEPARRSFALSKQRELPDSVRAAMRSALSSVRLAAVGELERLLLSPAGHTVLAARHALQALQENDNLVVSEAAKTALARGQNPATALLPAPSTQAGSAGIPVTPGTGTGLMIPGKGPKNAAIAWLWSLWRGGPAWVPAATACAGAAVILVPVVMLLQGHFSSSSSSSAVTSRSPASSSPSANSSPSASSPTAPEAQPAVAAASASAPIAPEGASEKSTAEKSAPEVSELSVANASSSGRAGSPPAQPATLEASAQPSPPAVSASASSESRTPSQASSGSGKVKPKAANVTAAAHASAPASKLAAVVPPARTPAANVAPTAVAPIPEAARPVAPSAAALAQVLAPEMVRIPAGRFLMGSPRATVPGKTDLEQEIQRSEVPQHWVQLEAFSIGAYDVTFQEWDACEADGGCTSHPSDESLGRERRPVINISWADANEYTAWLSRKTGQHYRLPTEAEWEYAARAGTTTPYYWGPEAGLNHANCRGCRVHKDSNGTVPVGSFEANPWGLRDMLGNVWQWTEDCYHESYLRAPADGSVWLSADCRARVIRGGAWNSAPTDVRAARRNRLNYKLSRTYIGFRLARTEESP